jgi:hypothetical protein
MSKLEMAFGPLVAALLIASAPQSFGKERAHASVSQWRNAFAEASGAEMTDRASALRECNGKVASMKEYTYGIQEVDKYRSCMAEHGQPE